MPSKSLVAAILVFLIGCSTTAKSSEDHLTLLTIEGRQHTIVISTGREGPLYTMKSSDGAIVFANLYMDQIRDQYPQIHKRLDTAVAAKDASIGHDQW